jgi:hypothetical protein
LEALEAQLDVAAALLLCVRDARCVEVAHELLRRCAAHYVHWYTFLAAECALLTRDRLFDIDHFLLEKKSKIEIQF